MRRCALLFALAALALALPAAAAHADGDPASDVLLSQDAFFPYSPPASAGAAKALLEVTKRARAAGWPVKVALIATETDLGAVSSLYGQPQKYADFLASEIGNPKTVRLLVVMGVGFGGENLGDHVDTALSGLPAPSNDGNVLATVAVAAVAKLATADGHPVTAPAIDTSDQGKRPYRESSSLHPGSRVPTAGTTGRKRVVKPPGSSNGGGAPVWLIVGVPVLLVLAGLGVVTLRGRHDDVPS